MSAEPVGQNGRLSSSFSFFSFRLIKTWFESNWISANEANIDIFSKHNFIQICGPIIKNEHLWVCTKLIPISLTVLENLQTTNSINAVTLVHMWLNDRLAHMKKREKKRKKWISWFHLHLRRVYVALFCRFVKMLWKSKPRICPVFRQRF